MEKKILEVLKEAGVPVYYISRKSNSTFPCLVYSFRETFEESSDDDEEITSYSIYINLYSTGNFIDLKNTVKKILKKHDFQKISIGIPVYDEELLCYELVLNYKYSLDA